MHKFFDVHLKYVSNILKLVMEALSLGFTGPSLVLRLKKKMSSPSHK